MSKQKKLTETTPLLQAFARNSLHSEMEEIGLARDKGFPLYEVQSGGNTLDMTRFIGKANQLFDKYNSIKIFKHEAGMKQLWRCKKNGKEMHTFEFCHAGI